MQFNFILSNNLLNVNKYLKNHSFEAYFSLLANVSATKIGKTKVAYEYILAHLASNLILPQVYAYEILAPESLPSS